MYSQDRAASADGRSSRQIYNNKNIKSSLPTPFIRELSMCQTGLGVKKVKLLKWFLPGVHSTLST